MTDEEFVVREWKDRAIKDRKAMAEEELRDRLFRTISLLHMEGWETETVIDAIYAHFREAGWKSGEEVEQIEDDVHAMYNDD